jgi:hypothetical protein
MSTEIHSPSKINISRYILFVLLFFLGGLILYKNYWKNPKGYSNVPEEVKLNYMPADFQIDIDEEDAIAILSNPQRYRREFNEMIYDLNVSILEHVGTRMGLTSAQRDQLEEEYENHHPYLRNLYYQDFIALQDSTSGLYELWYNNKATSASEILHEVASKYTCFMASHVLSNIIETQEGNFYAKGQKVDTPCGIALTEALQPMMKRIEERAAVKDLSDSRGMLEQKIERVITELATMEVQDKKSISKNLQTRIWGMAVSSTDLEVTALSVIKVGFKLNEYFDIQLNSQQGLVTVTLPEPTILSHEVYPRVENLDIGWLREIKEEDFNKNINLLRREFRRDALDSDIMDKAKNNAVDIMNTMFGPVVTSLNRRYSLRVKFRELDRDEEYEPEGEFSSLDD